MKSKWLQSTDFSKTISPITGNVILRNNSKDKSLIPEKLSLAKIKSVCNRVILGWTVESEWCRTAGTVYERAVMSLVALRSRESFISGFDNVIDTVIQGEINEPLFITRIGIRTRLLGLFSSLWSAGMLATPCRLPFSYRSQLDLNLAGLRKSSPWVLEIIEASNSTNEKNKRRAGLNAWRLAMTGLNIKEIGDIVPSSVQTAAIHDAVSRGTLIMSIRPILTIQKTLYGQSATITEHDWDLGRGRYQHPVKFDKIIAEFPDLVLWVQLFNEWFENGNTGSQPQKADTIKILIRYLKECSGVTRDPIVFVSRKYLANPRFEEWIDSKSYDQSTIAKRIATTANIFTWYVDVKLALEDDFGRPVRNPLFYCPITRRKEPPHKAETSRESLPLKYIRELIYIIKANDFEWSKKWKEDYVTRFNPMLNKWERIWCPVRAFAMLLKLYLPLRTYQGWMLQSGEADTEIFINGKWIKNNLPLHPKDNQIVRRGFLRRFIDQTTKREITGFYVNTNKTADRFKNNNEKGYEIPWQHDDVIQIVERLLEWQQNYNPIHQLTKWTSITHPNVTRSFTPAQLIARGESAFLFRDPAKAHKDQPIYTGRLSHFWKKLLDELEQRVAKRGECLSNGSPIRFIEKRSRTGVPMTSIFDLHTLRVSILTAFAVDGGVPLEILSKCVAGHANVLMTLYYIKQGPSYISQQLVEAQTKILEQEQNNYLRFIQDCDIENAESVIVFNDKIGLSSAQKASASGWVISDIGICPVGGARCSEGGPRCSGDKSRGVYEPTPGGARNCIRCRFFLTGPAFLGGLVAHFNSVGMGVVEASEQLKTIQYDISVIENDIFLHNLNSYSDQFSKVNTLYSRLESVMALVDDLANNWHSLFALIERSRTLIERQNEDTSSNEIKLIATTKTDDLRIAMSEATRFELYDGICQRATVCPNNNVPMANLRRGKLLDAMLSRNMKQPIFATLSDQEALLVGNQMVALLFARLGQHETNRLIEGSRLLKASGLSNEIDAFLNAKVPESIKLSSLLGENLLPEHRDDTAQGCIK